MSKVELEKYKEMMSALIENLVILYNKNAHFVTNTDSIRASRSITHYINEIKRQLPQISKQARLAHQEAYNNNKEQKELLRAKRKESVKKTIKENPNAHKPPKRTV
jgi:hypothetical protein